MTKSPEAEAGETPSSVVQRHFFYEIMFYSFLPFSHCIFTQINSLNTREHKKSLDKGKTFLSFMLKLYIINSLY